MGRSSVVLVAVTAAALGAGACQREDTRGGVAGDAETAVPAGAIPAPGDAPANRPEAAGAPLGATQGATQGAPQGPGTRAAPGGDTLQRPDTAPGTPPGF
jgi:hypothetical protein